MAHDKPPFRRDDAPAPSPGPAPKTGPPSGSVPARQQQRAIVRSDFEQVIRRAAELTLRDADADEQLSEAEVIRIASELGLPEHHVQRALFELPELAVQPRWYDRYFNPPVFTVSRVVPSQSPVTLRRVEEYLVTSEYLQIVRRRGDNIAFVPADDTISSLARAFFRSSKRHHIARASRVLVGVHALPDDNTHVRVDVDLSAERRSAVSSATVLGWFGGMVAGGIAAAAATQIGLPALGVMPEVLAFGGGMAATFAGSYSAAASRFRNRVHAAKVEITGLLDRLEHGERLDPPPAPWRRKLQGRLFGER
ncbi:hypothetical protein BH23GEM9_BH23GEM9_01630 [soil metagenome]